MQFEIVVGGPKYAHYAEAICEMIAAAAKIRGTGIAKRDPNYLAKKINQGAAVLALSKADVIGFCYIESWEDKKYVVNSGLIVHPDYRNTGLAKQIKAKAFELSKTLYPNAKLFGITTSMAVMKINADLGYKPVTFSELTKDEAFWKGCESCSNFDILQRTQRKMCLCTGMVCDLSTHKNNKKTSWESFSSFLKERKLRMNALFPFLNLKQKEKHEA